MTKSLADETDAADYSYETVQAPQSENDDRSRSPAPLNAVMTPRSESSPTIGFANGLFDSSAPPLTIVLV